MACCQSPRCTAAAQHISTMQRVHAPPSRRLTHPLQETTGGQTGMGAGGRTGGVQETRQERICVMSNLCERPPIAVDFALGPNIFFESNVTWLQCIMSRQVK